MGWDITILLSLYCVFRCLRSKNEGENPKVAAQVSYLVHTCMGERTEWEMNIDIQFKSKWSMVLFR